MSHLYPIAETAADALNEAKLAALTRYEAEALADGREILCLETEWLSPKGDNLNEIIDAAEAGPGLGFVQHYEDEKGAPVLAITYWKLGSALAAPKQKSPEPPAEPTEDHTDDLYFRDGRTKPFRKHRRKKFVDPRQMDMFASGADPEE